jgi:Helix-turn-helix domain
MPRLKQREETPLESVELYTCEELAKKLKVSRTTLQSLRIKGGGPRFSKIGKGRGGKVLYDWKDVLAYLEAGKRASTCDEGENR